MLILEYSRSGVMPLIARRPDFDIDAWIASRQEAFRTLGVYAVEYIRIADGAEMMHRHIQP
jgi:hypothetical protein